MYRCLRRDLYEPIATTCFCHFNTFNSLHSVIYKTQAHSSEQGTYGVYSKCTKKGMLEERLLQNYLHSHNAPNYILSRSDYVSGAYATKWSPFQTLRYSKKPPCFESTSFLDAVEMSNKVSRTPAKLCWLGCINGTDDSEERRFLIASNSEQLINRLYSV